MPITTFLVDLDDTIYPPSSGIWDLIGDRIDIFIHDRLNLDWEKIPALRQSLFLNYGTTMRGLVVNYGIDPEDYLLFVHQVPVEELIHPDPELTDALSTFTQKKVIFTNADERHARRVLRALQLEPVFNQIIDIRQIAPYCKPQPEAFQLALTLAGESLPQNCLVVDDSPRNLKAAGELGFRTVLVGKPAQDGVDYAIPTLKELPKIIGI